MLIFMITPLNYNNNLIIHTMQAPAINCVVDQCFLNSLKQLYQKRQKRLTWLAVRTIALLIALFANNLLLQEQSQDGLSILAGFILAALVYNTVETCLEAHFLCVGLRNMRLVQQVAIETHHSRDIKPTVDCPKQHIDAETTQYVVDHVFNIKVSRAYYDFVTSSKIDEVLEEFQIQCENKGEVHIKKALVSTLGCYKFLSSTFQFLSPVILAAGFTIRMQMPLTETQIGLLDIILITEIMIRSKVYALVLLIMIVPFFVLFMFFYLCMQTKPKIILPTSIRPSEELISKCNECAICLQPFQTSQKIIVLPCSGVHTFHCECISGWSRVKPSCPICRHTLCQ